MRAPWKLLPNYPAAGKDLHCSLPAHMRVGVWVMNSIRIRMSGKTNCRCMDVNYEELRHTKLSPGFYTGKMGDSPNEDLEKYISVNP